MQSTAEHWVPVVGYDGYYEVSDLGRLRNVRTGRLLKGNQERSGHWRVTFTVERETYRTTLHQVVIKAFVGPRPPGMEVRHLDGNPSNNRVSNLAWGTASENVLDRVTHGVHSMARKTHCPQGHPYDEVNTYHRIAPNGRPNRDCKTCRAWRGSKAYRRALKERKVAA